MFTPPNSRDSSEEEFGEPAKRRIEVSILERIYRLEAPPSNRRLLIPRDHTYHSLCDCQRCSSIRQRFTK
jgi:hypothetical protein